MDSSTRFTTNSCVARTLQRGVLGRAVVAVAGSKSADWRVGAEQVEEAERRGVHPAIGTDGRDERNRPRRDKTGENRIGAVGKFVFEIAVPWRAKNYRQTREARNVSSIHVVGEWAQIALGFQFELFVFAQKFFEHDFGIFLRLQAAGAVNQNAAGLQLRRGKFQQSQLRLLQPRDFLRRNPPAQIHAAPHDSGVRARSVNQNSIEF